MNITNIQTVTPNMVRSVYSGKLGCACGCRGKHYYASEHIAKASKDRGYPVTADEVNDVMVERVLDTLKACEKTEIQDGYILHAEIGKRLYMAYLAAS